MSKRIVWAAVALLAIGCPDDETGSNPPSGSDAGNTQDSSFTPPDTSAQGCVSNTECADFGDPGPCQQAICDKTTGACTIIAVVDGTNCDDGDPCTSNDQCNDGACGGTAKSCNDGNLCTDDSCDPATGQCTTTNNAAACNDNDLCTENDQCSGGVCTGTSNGKCNCENDADCEQFDDGNLCNGTLECVNQACVQKAGSVVDCGEAGDQCQQRLCDPGTGQCKDSKVNDGTSCDDGSACTTGDACTGGVCKGTQAVCDDENPCTDDTCDTATGCVYTNNTNACDDGDLCTTGDACADGSCTGTANPDCEGCTVTADCAAFEDGNLCNGSLVCTDGKCVVDAASVVTCGGAVSACATETCEPTTGQCVTKNALNGTECNDENACTKGDHCTDGTCGGNPVVCDDENPCTTDGCDAATGCTTADDDGASCDDGSSCTSDDTCSGGECVGTGDCGCSSTADCLPLEDGNLCNGTMECIEGQCKVNPATVVTCASTGIDPCLTVSCIPATGACKTLPLADGSECDDDNQCTGPDFCTAGVCAGKPVACDDGNLCTTDTCEPDAGCTFKVNDAECNDGNDCTTGDVCKAGTCAGTPTQECGCTSDADCGAFEDGNPCTGTLVCVASKCVTKADSVVTCPPLVGSPCQISACSPESGQCEVQNALDGKACDDGDACTTGDTCTTGECTSSGTKTCSDENPCTDDTCNPDFGCVFVPNTASCDDGDPCTEGDACSDSVCMPGPTNTCGTLCEAQWALQCGSFDSWGTDLSGASNSVEEYNCSPFTYTGPEYTYLFQAPYNGTLTVSLSGEEDVTDLMVLQQTEAGCDPTNCLDYGFASASIQMQVGKAYYFVVDGFDGAQGGYGIEVDCKPNNEVNCIDGADDDDDGFIDCDDSDCDAAPACQPPKCIGGFALGCGEGEYWSTEFFGSTNLLDGYEGCDNPYGYSGGPEYAYIFEATVDGTVVVTLEEESSETDIIVLGGGNGCDSNSCIAYGFGEAQFEAVAGETYYLVVDGYNGASGSYHIQVNCDVDPTTTETKCADEIDNDNDGSTDCQDPDCADLPFCDTSCQPKSFLTFGCGQTTALSTEDLEYSKNATLGYSCNEFDYTGPELSGVFVAPFDGTLTVNLGNEEADTDVLIIESSEGVCDPQNCLADGLSSAQITMEEGKTYYIVVDGFAGEKGAFELSVDCVVANEQSCTDGNDEDQDGLVDCQDPDCFGVSSACQPACVPDDVLPAQLECPEDTDDFTSDGTGSTDIISAYQGCGQPEYTGNEYVYTYVAQTSGPIEIDLDESGLFATKLDIFVLEDQGQGCNPAACVAWSTNVVDFEAEAGKTYYVVIDGRDEHTNDYDIEMTCE